MQVVTKNVHVKGALVATVEVEVAESVQEAIEIAGSEDGVVARFNRAWASDRMNSARPAVSTITVL